MLKILYIPGMSYIIFFRISLSKCTPENLFRKAPLTHPVWVGLLTHDVRDGKRSLGMYKGCAGLVCTPKQETVLSSPKMPQNIFPMKSLHKHFFVHYLHIYTLIYSQKNIFNFSHVSPLLKEHQTHPQMFTCILLLSIIMPVHISYSWELKYIPTECHICTPLSNKFTPVKHDQTVPQIFNSLLLE